MFSRAGSRLSRQARKVSLNVSSVRSLVISPAINEHPGFVFPGVLPFGFDFVSDDLRAALESKGVDVDILERDYNKLIQNDCEFNNAALPSEGSALFGFIYATRLVEAKVEYQNLTKSEDFKKNYLRAQIEELQTRLKRYYPNLDFSGELAMESQAVANGPNAAYEAAKCEGISTLIAENGNNSYLSLFENNSFIEAYDETDEYNDYLPAALESKIIDYYNFYFSYSSSTANGTSDFAATYFDNLIKLEKAVETPLNAIQRELRQNFGLFMLNTFGSNNLSLASSVISLFTNASSLFVTEAAASVDKCLGLLDIKSGKVSGASANVLAQLFFGNTSSAAQLNGKDASQVAPLLASAGEERIALIYNALQVESCLKTTGAARVLLSILLSTNREFVGQFATNSENIEAFSSANSGAFDNLVTLQRTFYKSQESLSQALTKFSDALVASVTKRGADKAAVSAVVGSALSEGLGSAGNVSCPFAEALNKYSSECASAGNVYGQLQGLIASSYLSNSNGSVAFYELANGLINPPRNGLTGSNLSNIANVLANDASTAQEAIFGGVGSYLQQNGLLSQDDSSSIANTLADSVSNEYDALKSAAAQFDQARLGVNAAIQTVTLNTEGNFSFQRVYETYRPLDIHLSQYRYLTNS